MSKLIMGIVWSIVICLSATIGIFIGALAGMIAFPITVVGWLRNDTIETTTSNDSI